MKKIFTIIAIALISISMFAAKDIVPAVSDLVTAGYDVTNARVIALSFDEEVCNDIVWVGTYNGWSTDLAQMQTFKPLESFDGWYVLELYDASGTVQGKPVQLKTDGTFSWDYQSGDADAWINMAQPNTKMASIANSDIDGEADCTWPTLGAYIYEVAYFKKHNTPCVIKPKRDYTISAYVPELCAAILEYKDNPILMGSFDNWTNGIAMKWKEDEKGNEYLYAELKNVEEGTEFKLRFGTDWNIQVQFEGKDLANEKTDANTDIVLRYDGEGYDFAACAAPVISNNVILYTASAKLTETKDMNQKGLHTGAFNVDIVSHEFDEKTKTGVITFSGDVTRIGNYAFRSCSGLTSAIIPDAVTSIGYYAFGNCNSLTSITIGKSVITIDDMAFTGCIVLTSVTINSNDLCSEQHILNKFSSQVRNLIIGNSVKRIGYGTFQRCSLTSVLIGDSVTEIGDYAFNECYDLYSVIIGNTVTKIGSKAFYNCALSSVTIPNSVTTIGDNAFQYCFGLTSVTIGYSVTAIGQDAFSSCTKITSVTWNAKNCTGWSFGSQVESFVFGEDVEVIPPYLCQGMDKLTSISIPNSVTTIGEGTFADCTGLISVTIPNSVIIIEDWAFYHCSSLTSVTIPSSVTTIGKEVFSYSNLSSIIVDKENTVYDNRDNCNAIIETASNTLIVGCRKTIIPSSITTIGRMAFGGCKGLTLISIPNSVSKIDNEAFRNCTDLASITTYAINPPLCGTDCFYGVDKSIPVYVPARSLDNYKQVEGWKEFANIQGNPSDYATVLCLAENGTISGDGKYIKGDTCTLTAIANYGYHFTQWSDSVTDNPREIIVTQDTTYTAEFAKNIYTISVEAVHGSITGGGDYEYLSNVQLTATADEHYHFVRWSDEVTDNPRQITVDGDKTYTAIFSIDQHTISASAEHGSVNGTGIYDYGTEATLTIIPDFGYEFAAWSDGNTDNPRTVLVTEDATYNSTCTLATKGTCGDNLYWEYKDGSLIINGQGAMYNFAFDQVSWILYRDSIQQVELFEGLTNVGNNAFASCSKLTSVNIPNTVTTIGESAFEDCTYLKTITLGKALTDIGCNAFKGDFRIEEITSYAEVTPNVCSSTFDGLSKQYIYLYVPENSIRGYQVDPNWNVFDIRTKAAEVTPIDSDKPIVEPTDQDVTIIWPITDGADTYTLTITKNGETVCVLTFNANGQLINIAFAAPGHNGAHQAPAATLTAQGYQFTVTGLNPGTAYDYSVTATDAGGQTLAEHKGNFSTTGGGTPTSMDKVHDAQWTMHKYFHNGNLIIERNGIKYTPAGQKVK